jgi:hypothetical protein
MVAQDADVPPERVDVGVDGIGFHVGDGHDELREKGLQRAFIAGREAAAPLPVAVDALNADSLLKGLPILVELHDGLLSERTS